jgi:integrase
VLSIRAGDDATTLQANLGHHAAAFALDQYSHFTEQMRKESSERIQKLVEKEFSEL